MERKFVRMTNDVLLPSLMFEKGQVLEVTDFDTVTQEWIISTSDAGKRLSPYIRLKLNKNCEEYTPLCYPEELDKVDAADVFQVYTIQECGKRMVRMEGYIYTEGEPGWDAENEEENEDYIYRNVLYAEHEMLLENFMNKPVRLTFMDMINENTKVVDMNELKAFQNQCKCLFHITLPLFYF